jgi:hypothetical protein
MDEARWRISSSSVVTVASERSRRSTLRIALPGMTFGEFGDVP